MSYHNIKEYSKAISDYSEAIRLNPKNKSYYSNRASAYENMNMTKEAESDREKGISLE
jgi:tetratricopeptide (TPR) repeat protein